MIEPAMFEGIETSQIVKVILLTLMAGAAIPLGGLLARIERLRPKWLEQELRHSVIALQNLPEGFNAYREQVAGGHAPHRVMALFVALVPLGPIAGLLGLTILAPHTAIVGAIMLFAAGGILYLTFEDIAPQAHLERRWVPALGAVAGFVIGMIGQMLLH
jgi:hypothetical protein